MGANGYRLTARRSFDGVDAPVGSAVAAIQKAAQSLHLPATIATSFQGNARAFQASLRSTPILILAALIAVYLILRYAL
jgi:multidrug efflux pump subunit AcrB